MRLHVQHRASDVFLGLVGFCHHQTGHHSSDISDSFRAAPPLGYFSHFIWVLMVELVVKSSSAVPGDYGWFRRSPHLLWMEAFQPILCSGPTLSKLRLSFTLEHDERAGDPVSTFVMHSVT